MRHFTVKVQSEKQKGEKATQHWTRRCYGAAGSPEPDRLGGTRQRSGDGEASFWNRRKHRQTTGTRGDRGHRLTGYWWGPCSRGARGGSSRVVVLPGDGCSAMVGRGQSNGDTKTVCAVCAHQRVYIDPGRFNRGRLIAINFIYFNVFFGWFVGGFIG